MSEFFLELFSEEIPSGLQKKLRTDLLESFKKNFNEKFEHVEFAIFFQFLAYFKKILNFQDKKC